MKNRKFNKMLSEAVAQFENRQEADEIYERIKVIYKELFLILLYFDGRGGNSAIQCSLVWKLQKTLLKKLK